MASHILPVPDGARLFHLAPGAKTPPRGFTGAHHNAVAVDDFVVLDGNYGIALEESGLVAIDLDAPGAEERLDGKLTPTWVQQARRGTHHVYKLPAGVDARTLHNAKLVIDGQTLGDIKVRGYIVGPGSRVAGHVYAVVRDCPPVELPAHFLAVLRGPGEPKERDPGEGVEIIVKGERDDDLYALARYLRRRLGFSQTGIEKALQSFVTGGLIEQVEGDEIRARDVRRIARSASRTATDPATKISDPILTGMRQASEIALIEPPRHWHLHGAVPHGELVLLYGAGGCGKSTWGSWLAAQTTHRGHNVAFMGVEEPFSRFALRVAHGQGALERLFEIESASRLLLPHDVGTLIERCELAQVRLLYIDSIYSHFSRVEGENVAERTRRCLGPLAEACRNAGIAVVGVFHENKAKEYLGSPEMINVARVVLHARRLADSSMHVEVVKTNYVWGTANYSYIARLVDACDPRTGELQIEYDEDGNRVKVEIAVAELVNKDVRGVSIPASEIGDIGEQS